ncbi:hypothetical protein BZG36_05657, partial [Bifiguratus adelaidae]
TGKILAKTNLGSPFITAVRAMTSLAILMVTVADVITSDRILGQLPSSLEQIRVEIFLLYMWSKTYTTGAASGIQNARYLFHALDVKTLTTKWSYNPEGIIADNDPTIYFVGGIALQRPALLLENGVIYAGFGSHCDNYNYTGTIIGVDTSGRKTSFWSAAAGANRKTGSGIWMGGCGLSSDGTGRMFAVTGNGGSGVTTPTPGKTPGPMLPQAAVSLGINSNGILSAIDFFEPYNYMGLGDSDFGSG